MQTNTLSILDFPPILKGEHINEILGRIRTLHPAITEEGANIYLCDLFGVKSLDLIEGDFLTYYETEPALSREELKAFAERIVSYNNGQLRDAIYAARNILNSVPKSLDDLIDYTTAERKAEFVLTIISSLPIDPRKTDLHSITLSKLIKITSQMPQPMIDLLCGMEMERFQSIPITENDGLTFRQKMLFSAANYYLNHLVGFSCNSLWLAAFLSHQEFGCQAGWIHYNGNSCRNKNFGFKDDASAISLVSSHLDYIKEFFESYVQANYSDRDDMQQNFDLYVKTALFAVQNIIKQNTGNVKNASSQIAPIINLLLEYDEYFNNEQSLLKETVLSILRDERSITKSQIETITEIAKTDSDEVPEKFMGDFYDAWNFMVVDALHDEKAGTFTISPHFLRAQYFEHDLLETAQIIANKIEDGNYPEHALKLFKGFLTNYLWSLINRHSDTHLLYDTILKVALFTQDKVDNQYIIRGMAELGHTASMRVISESTEGREKAYWERRISIRDKERVIH